MNLSDFCYVKDNSLSPDICDDLIDLFHSCDHLHEKINNDRKPNFTQLNFTANLNLNPDLHQRIMESTFAALAEYKERVPESKYWQPNCGFEQFRIKYYKRQTEDQFDDHVDAISKGTSIRFLAFFWYLTDIDVGGETEFLNFDMKISSKKGRLFIFPPLWMYPHRGNVAISRDKYLLSSYLHFT